MAACPWDGFEAATIAFCENRLCSWVVEPANTWSNIGFVIVGLYLYWHAKRHSLPNLHYIGAIVFFEGLGSAFFHGSGTFIGEVADVGCMYLISGMFICVALLRIGTLNHRQALWLYLVIAVGSTAVLIWFKTIGIALFAFQVTLATILEIYLRRFRRSDVRYGWLLTMVICFAIAFFIWNMDIRGIWCDPDNHIFTGHSAWHLLNAFCMYCYYQFVRQFVERGSWVQ